MYRDLEDTWSSSLWWQEEGSHGSGMDETFGRAQAQDMHVGIGLLNMLEEEKEHETDFHNFIDSAIRFDEERSGRGAGVLYE